MRRGRSSVPISLFSFQDIITSVTGIVILITLLLALELVQARPSTEAVATEQMIARLRAELIQGRELHADLQRRLQQFVQGHTARHGKSRRELVHELAILAEQLARMRADQDAIDSDLRRRQRAAEDARSAWEQRAQDRQQLEDLQVRTEEAEKQLQQLLSTNRVIYRATGGSPLRCWVVEISGRQIAAALAGVVAPPQRFLGSGDFTRVDELVRWVKTLNPAEDALFLVLSPDGLETFDTAFPDLRATGVSMGFDLLGPNQHAIDATQGAGW